MVFRLRQEALARVTRYLHLKTEHCNEVARGTHCLTTFGVNPLSSAIVHAECASHASASAHDRCAKRYIMNFASEASVCLQNDMQTLRCSLQLNAQMHLPSAKQA